MELTKTQLGYLAAIKRLEGSRTSLMDIAGYLEISKPTASVALKVLTQKGLVMKKNGGAEYILTDAGSFRAEQLEYERFMFNSICVHMLGMDRELTAAEYERICGSFSKKFLEELKSRQERGFPKTADFDDGQNINSLEPGVYEVPFQVKTSGLAGRSMGDKGFEHPCQMLMGKDRKEFCLRSRKINYRSREGKKLKGSLEGLYYQQDVRWLPAEKRDDCLWAVPMNAVYYQRDEFGSLSIGVLRIKAVATSPQMPESIAEISLNFKLMKKKKSFT